VVRDRVRGVAIGLHVGLYLYGRPGTGKTRTVLTTLADAEARCHYHRGHATPMGLFDLLAEHHRSVIVLDDVAGLLTQNVAVQLLLAALGHGDGFGTRVVKYQRQGRRETVHFEGRLICVSNPPIRETPLLQTLKSRMHCLEFNPSDDELAALMRQIACAGWPADKPILPPATCVEVAEFVIEESRRLGCRLDLRALVEKALPDRAQFDAGQTECHWRDLVVSMLQQRAMDLRHPLRCNGQIRQPRKEAECQVVQDILATYLTRSEQLAAWRKKTGKSERAFYRRLSEIE